MIYWIVISIVFGFMFGYFLGDWSAKYDLKTMEDLKQEYKITTHSMDLEQLLFIKAIRREDLFNMSSDTIELYVIENIANQIKPYIKDKMFAESDPFDMNIIYKFNIWVRR